MLSPSHRLKILGSVIVFVLVAVMDNKRLVCQQAGVSSDEPVLIVNMLVPVVDNDVRPNGPTATPEIGIRPGDVFYSHVMADEKFSDSPSSVFWFNPSAAPAAANSRDQGRRMCSYSSVMPVNILGWVAGEITVPGLSRNRSYSSASAQAESGRVRDLILSWNLAWWGHVAKYSQSKRLLLFQP